MTMSTVWAARSITRLLIWIVLLAGTPQMVFSASVFVDQETTQSLSPAQRIEYVTKLGLIQGHLWVAAQLVEAGHPELGAKHAKHPGQEVYQELSPFFSVTKSRGFASELEAMSGRFHGGSAADFRRAYVDVMSTVANIVDAQSLSAQAKLRVVGALVKQASIEYQAGVKDSAIVDLQEYQDARGFVEIAHELLAKDSRFQGAASGQTNELLVQIRAVKMLWPSLKPSGEILGDGHELALLSATLETMANEPSVAY